MISLSVAPKNAVPAAPHRPPPPAAAGGQQGGRRLAMVIAALLLVNGLLLAATLALSKTAQEMGVSPIAYGFWMTLGGGLLLGAGALVRRPPVPVSGQFNYWLVSGALSIAVPQLLVFIAVGQIGAGLAGVAFALPTLATWAMARLFGIEGRSRMRLAGAALGAVGATILVMPSAGALPPGATPWMLLVLAAPVVIAGGNIYRRVAWPENARPIELAAGMLLAAAGMFLVLAIVFGSDLAFWTLEGASLPIVAQMILAAAQFLAYFALQKRAPPVIFSLIGQIPLVAGLIGGALLLGERYSAVALAAVGLMVAGLLFIVFGKPGQATGRWSAKG
ncbi:MAG: DMT family transporter [Ectothiorhodospiraceae bacterium]|nr:DMT family transporter [Ectothiorhodospiraceae bacterium]